jgi:hypothetical protein
VLRLDPLAFPGREGLCPAGQAAGRRALGQGQGLRGLGRTRTSREVQVSAGRAGSGHRAVTRERAAPGRHGRRRCGLSPRPPTLASQPAGIHQPHTCPVREHVPFPTGRCNGSAEERAPRPGAAATRDNPARLSRQPARAPGMRSGEGEAKCGHGACAVRRHKRLRGSPGMLGESHGSAHAQKRPEPATRWWRKKRKITSELRQERPRFAGKL